MNTLQTAHPNDITRGRWKTTSRFDNASELSEHLASPEFETYHGLVSRLLNDRKEEIYCAIFNAHGEWINASPGSDLFEKTRFGHDSREEQDFVSNKSWPEAWDLCKNGAWMLAAASYALPREQFLLANVVCIETMIKHIPKTKVMPHRSLEFVKQWARGEKTQKDAKAFYKKLLSYEKRATTLYPGWFDAIVETTQLAVAWIAYPSSYRDDQGTIARVLCDAHSMMMELDDSNNNHFAVKAHALANVVRRTIPLYDVLTGLTK